MSKGREEKREQRKEDRKEGGREEERKGQEEEEKLLTRLVLSRLGKCCLQKVSDCGIHHLLPALGEMRVKKGREEGGGMERGRDEEREERWYLFSV